MILRHTFSPPDNARMAHLCGPLDAHLRTIEMALNVKVAHRFEQFRIEGPKAKAERALEVLQALYERARRAIPAEQVQLMLTGETALGDTDADALTVLSRRGEIRGRTPNQSHYLAQISTHDITFGIGPAGTGKTYLAVACAVDALERGAVQRIVLTRPAVEAGEKLGFLPGDLGQKVDPYLRPLYDALYDLMGHDKVQKAFERQQIEIGRALEATASALDGHHGQGLARAHVHGGGHHIALGLQVGDPGQAAVQAQVTGLFGVGSGLDLQLFDLRQKLHRIRQTGGAGQLA